MEGGVFADEWFWKSVEKRLAKRERDNVKKIRVSELNSETMGLIGASVIGFKGLTKIGG